MDILTRSLVSVWNFISVSAWSPSIVFVTVWVLVLLLRLRASRVPWKTLSIVLGVLIGGSALIYLLIPTLQDDVEAAIAAVSALTLRGWPMYPSPQAIHRYIVAYGPLTFAARIPTYWLFGTTLFSFKLPGVVAFFASATALYKICRYYAPAGASLLGLGCCFVVFLRFIPDAFWGRGDPFLICMVALCIWAVLAAPSWAVLLVAGVTFAMLPNIKITGGAYLFPIVWLIVSRQGWKIAAGSIALGIVLFSLPFFSSQVSLSNYWFSLNNSRHALRVDILWRDAQYSAIMLLPILSIVVTRKKKGFSLSKDQAIYLALILCSLTTSCFTGANSGSGPHHLIPCLPPILHLYFWLRSGLADETPTWSSSRLALVCTISMLVFSAVNVRLFLATLRHAGMGREAVAEIRKVEAAQSTRGVQVGIGRDFVDFRTVYGAVTTLDGQPYTIGGLAVRELQVAGVGIPEATLDYMERCGTGTWLIPKGDAPFSAPDPYFSATYPTFDQEFQKTFLEHYRKSSSGVVYDIWSCRE